MTTTKKILIAAAGIAGFIVWRRMRAGATLTEAVGIDTAPVPLTSVASTATPDPTRTSTLRQYVPAPTSTTDATRAMGF